MADHPEHVSSDHAVSRVHMATEAGPLAAAVSGVSWGAIFAGAAGASALSFVLVLLGTGLGLSAVSPWSSEGIGAATFGWATIAWVTFISLAASGIGGYLAGRLRTKWSGLHTAEVYFRDTAHGFLAWSVATLLAVAMVSSAVGSAASAGAKAGASVAGGAASALLAAGAAGAAGEPDAGDGPMGYFIDSLFRRPTDTSTNPEATAAAGENATPPLAKSSGSEAAPPAREVYRIFANSVRTGELAQDDAQYVAQLIARQTGISQEEAEKRVADVYDEVQQGIDEAAEKAKVAADKARKATAYGSLWLVISLLVGAFVASFAATMGGRRRDLQSTL